MGPSSPGVANANPEGSTNDDGLPDRDRFGSGSDGGGGGANSIIPSVRSAAEAAGPGSTLAVTEVANAIASAAARLESMPVAV